MSDLYEGEERPTANLRFFKGILHQQWEIGYRDYMSSHVGMKMEWRKVPSDNEQ